MRKPELLLVGAGGHAAACIDVIEQEDRFRIAGLLGFPEEVGKQVLGYPILDSDAELGKFAGLYQYALIGIGQIKSPDLRMRLFHVLKEAGYELPMIVSPRAYVSKHAQLGEGTIVMHGATINARASVGRNCIVNSMALIEHDVQIDDHCHIATAAIVNGGVTISTGTFVGSNSVIRQVVKLGERCIVGMGQVVRSDCADRETLPAAGDAP